MKKIKSYLKEKVWGVDELQHGFFVSVTVKSLKVALITINDFFKDKCHVLASSLTYYTLLALVPLLALVFVVIKETGVQNIYGVEFLNHLLLNPEASEMVIEYVNKTDLSALGIIGAVALLKLAAVLLANIEHYFNDIWGIKEKRHFIKRISYYLFVVIILPVLVAAGLTVAVNYAGRIIPVSRGYLPYVIAFSGFTMLYTVFPNVKVRMTASLIGGLIAGLLWLTAQRLFVGWAYRATELNIIYGSFSQLVLIFMWIYISWMIILLGAEVSFAVQNYDIYKKSETHEKISLLLKEKIVLLTAAVVYELSGKARKKVSAQEIVRKIGGFVRIVNETLYELKEIGILDESQHHKERFFRPAEGKEDVSVWDVLEKIKLKGNADMPLNNDEVFKNVEDLLTDAENVKKEKFKKVFLKDLYKEKELYETG